LLNEGSGQKQDFVLRTQLHVLKNQEFTIGFHTGFLYGCKLSKIAEKFRSVWLYFFLLKYIKAMTFLVFNLEANNVLL
jgi:hypothetical protein